MKIVASPEKARKVKKTNLSIIANPQKYIKDKLVFIISTEQSF